VKIDLSQLPDRKLRVISAARRIVPGDVAVYLVGGVVRDLLQQRPPGDIDLVAEGGVAAFAARLAESLGGRLESTPRFGTFTIEPAEGGSIDIATARREIYPHPGALPVVTPSTLADDLQRRDFTINAIACNLRSEELIDPHGGRDDLRAGLVRILHRGSFLDDPTRIFRALRFAARLGFELERETLQLLNGAVSGGALKTISKERIWREIDLAIGEADGGLVLAGYTRHGALAATPGVEELTPERQTEISEALKLAKEFPQADQRLLLLAALFEAAPAATAFDGSGLTRRKVELLRRIVADRRTVARKLAASPPPRFLLRAERLPLELLLAAASVDPHLQLKLEQLDTFSRIPVTVERPALPAAGPEISRAISHARLAVHCGTVPADQASSFATARALKYLQRRKSGPLR
jgi:tRNA nucleotidyltransferase/poly(A) polymerase